MHIEASRFPLRSIPVGDEFEFAANLFDRVRWVQKPSKLNKGWCAATAIQYAMRELSRTQVSFILLDRVKKSLSQFARSIGGQTFQDIYDWNDAPGRTVQEVQAALRACAMMERARAKQEKEMLGKEMEAMLVDELV